MTTKRISGQDVRQIIDGTQLNFDEVSLSIEDERTPVFNQGVPNGYVNGKVSASGEIKLDWKNFDLLFGKAKAAGSWRGMPTFDMSFLSTAGKENMDVDVYGILINVSDLLDLSHDAGEKAMVTVPFEVTSNKFVDIQGIPYLEASDTADLIPA